MEGQDLGGLLGGSRCGIVDAAGLRKNAHVICRAHCAGVAAAADGPGCASTAILVGLATVRLVGVCRIFHTLAVVRIAVLTYRSGDAFGRCPVTVSVQANVCLYRRRTSRRG